MKSNYPSTCVSCQIKPVPNSTKDQADQVISLLSRSFNLLCKTTFMRRVPFNRFFLTVTSIILYKF